LSRQQISSITNTQNFTSPGKMINKKTSTVDYMLKKGLMKALPLFTHQNRLGI